MKSFESKRKEIVNSIAALIGEIGLQLGRGAGYFRPPPGTSLNAHFTEFWVSVNGSPERLLKFAIEPTDSLDAAITFFPTPPKLRQSLIVSDADLREPRPLVTGWLRERLEEIRAECESAHED